MKILMISGLFPRNYKPHHGIFIYDQVKALAEIGNDIDVIVPTPIAPRLLSVFSRKWKQYVTSEIHHQVALKAVQVPYFRPPGVWFKRYEGLSCYYFIRNAVRRLHEAEKYDVILSNCVIPDGYAAVRVGRELNIPTICSPIGSDIMVFPKIYKFTLKSNLYCLLNANLVYANSRRLARETEELTGNRISVDTVYRGCSFELFSKDKYSKETIRKFHHIENGDLVFTFTGHMIKEKGIEELVRAFSAIAGKHKNVKLSLIGDGPYINQMKNILSERGVSERVLWHGAVEHRKVPELLAMADYFVLPSYSEGMPNALIEAMAMELPVIATNVGGIPEVVENEKTGLLLNPRSAKELGEAMERYIENREWAAELGRDGLEKIRKMMDRSIISQQLQRLLESVLDHRY